MLRKRMVILPRRPGSWGFFVSSTLEPWTNFAILDRILRKILYPASPTPINTTSMKANGKTVDEILTSLPEDRVEPINKLHEVIIKNLPKGFEPAMSYGGLGYVVPHKTYPAGYHCNPAEPLPF